MISFEHKGNFSKTDKFLNALMGRKYLNVLDKYGQMGVEALKQATPKDTGLTSESWSYQIEKTPDTTTITFTNSNINKWANIAIILDTGHGTRNGGYVAGRHYIEPAVVPIFEKIAKEAWKEVTSL